MAVTSCLHCYFGIFILELFVENNCRFVYCRHVARLGCLLYWITPSSRMYSNISYCCSSGLDDFQRECIIQHNIYRHQHRACRLVWSDDLANAAEAWAEHLASNNVLEHASDKDHGENLASAKGYELRGDKVAEMWYDEIKDYNFETPAYNAKCGHFTQMIWRDTKQLGVAKTTATDGTQYVVARYYPAGNVLGEFKTSIRRARGQRSSVRKRRRSSARRKTSQTDASDVISQQGI